MVQDPEEVARLRAEFAEEVTRASSAFDKAVTALAAGGLALSITFVRDIAPELKETWRLGIAWVALVGALLCSMASFFTSEQAHRHLIGQLELGEDLTRDAWGVATLVLNVKAGLGVAIGAGFLAYFAFGNL
jgi:hypothetical protein